MSTLRTGIGALAVTALAAGVFYLSTGVSNAATAAQDATTDVATTTGVANFVPAPGEPRSGATITTPVSVAGTAVDRIRLRYDFPFPLVAAFGLTNGPTALTCQAAGNVVTCESGQFVPAPGTSASYALVVTALTADIGSADGTVRVDGVQGGSVASDTNPGNNEQPLAIVTG